MEIFLNRFWSNSDSSHAHGHSHNFYSGEENGILYKKDYIFEFK